MMACSSGCGHRSLHLGSGERWKSGQSDLGMKQILCKLYKADMLGALLLRVHFLLQFNHIHLGFKVAVCCHSIFECINFDLNAVLDSRGCHAVFPLNTPSIWTVPSFFWKTLDSRGQVACKNERVCLDLCSGAYLPACSTGTYLLSRRLVPRPKATV